MNRPLIYRRPSHRCDSAKRPPDSEARLVILVGYCAGFRYRRFRSSAAPSSLSRLDLLQRGAEEFLHFGGDLMLRNALGRQISRHFVQCVLATLVLKLRNDERI